jgi:probable rRNA maturation factor
VNDTNPRHIDASLLICVDVAKRQAAERKLLPKIELLLYTTHGILHCLGWDDEADDDFAAMHAFEDALLETIGVGKVFGDSRADKL